MRFMIHAITGSREDSGKKRGGDRTVDLERVGRAVLKKDSSHTTGGRLIEAAPEQAGNSLS